MTLQWYSGWKTGSDCATHPGHPTSYQYICHHMLEIKKNMLVACLMLVCVCVCVVCVCVSNVFTHTRTRLPGRCSSFHTHYMTDLWPHPYIHTLQSARHTASGGSPMHCSYTVNTHRLVLMGYHSNQLNTWRMAVWKHSKQIFTIKVALIRWRLQYITKGLKTDVT